MPAAKSILPTAHIVTSMRLMGFVLVFLACACKARNSSSTAKDYKVIDNGPVSFGRVKYLCWSGILSSGLKEKLVFCAQNPPSDGKSPRPLTGPTVALRADQFYDQIRAHIKGENDAEMKRQKEELEQKWQAANRDLKGQKDSLDEARRELADFRKDLQTATGSEAAIFQTVIAALETRIKTFETDIATAKTKIPASNPRAPQSDSAKGKYEDQVNVLERIVDARGTISSDDLDNNFEQIDMAILKTIELGAPVELLWHWISNNEIAKAEQFINIPRTTDLSGVYLLVTKIRSNVLFPADTNWALQVSSGFKEVKTVKSNTGPLKPGETRPLNLLVPLGSNSCLYNLTVVLKSCERIRSWRCAENIGALYLDDIRPYSYQIGRFNFLQSFGERPSVNFADESLIIDAIYFCIE